MPMRKPAEEKFEKKAPIKVAVPKKPTYLHAELDPDLHAKLKSWVAMHRTNMTATVQKMVEEFLKKHT